MLKHKHDRAGLSEVSAALVKEMAHIACGTVAVIGKRFNNNGDACRTVALVYQLLIFRAALLTGCFFDYAVDIVVRHVVCLSLGDNIAQLSVYVGVGTACADDHGKLTTYSREDLGSCLIGLFLFSFNGTPF